MTSSDTAPKRDVALRVGAQLELDFTDLLTNGQAVGRADGMAVFCFGPLPEERARVRITEVKQRYAVADMVELLRDSPLRARPFCPVFGSCGGCQLQHLSYPAQLAWKREVVRNALLRIGGFANVELGETVGMSEPRAYRNKMSLVVDHSIAPPAVGFYRQRSHDVVPIEACPVVTPQLNADLGRLAALRSHALRDARHLVARSARATGQVVLTVTTAHQSEEVRRVAASLLQELPGLVGVTNSFDPASANAILGRRHRLVAGEGEIEEVIGAVRYRVSAASFFQINVEMVARIFDFLKPWLEPPRRILDLYCGAGTFALYFAKYGWSVYGVEENAHAIAEAVANAQRNGLQQNARFETGRVEQMVSTAPFQNSLREADVVFLDPPRKGCDELTLGAVARARVPKIWYLSCDPATLARDLKFLVAKNYRLATVQPFDMFPQTGHIETLVELEYSKLATRNN